DAGAAAPRAAEGVPDRVRGVERRAEHAIAVGGQLGAVVVELAERVGTRDRRLRHSADFREMSESGRFAHMVVVAGEPFIAAPEGLLDRLMCVRALPHAPAEAGA